MNLPIFRKLLSGLQRKEVEWHVHFSPGTVHLIDGPPRSGWMLRRRVYGQWQCKNLAHEEVRSDRFHVER
jgi:hypothetical protein